MKFKLNQNLGFEDARTCNSRFNAGLEIEAEKLTAGSTIDISSAAAEFLKSKYPALLDDPRETRAVRGEAKSPEVKAVPPA